MEYSSSFPVHHIISNFCNFLPQGSGIGGISMVGNVLHGQRDYSSTTGYGQDGSEISLPIYVVPESQKDKRGRAEAYICAP